MNIDWDRKGRQVRLNTHDACHAADRGLPQTRGTPTTWSPETVDAAAHDGAPLPWLAVTDGQQVITEAKTRLDADGYSDDERGLADGPGPARQFAPLWGADRG